MLKHMKTEFNKTTTENGDVAFNSTKSKVLDLFALGGAYRSRSKDEAISLFNKAYSENPTLAVKTLFYLRDIRGGQGERKFFRTIMTDLCNRTKKDIAVKLLQHIPEYGRWDDLISLYGNDKEVDDTITALIFAQLKLDVDSDTPSLLGKWLPSENTSSKETVALAKIVRNKLDLTSKEYRKMLTKLRAKIKIVETKISSKDYKSIEYGSIPSKAGMKYRKAFFRNDEERYTAFIDSVNKGERTINAGTLYPYEIFAKARSGYDASLEAFWKNLPNYVKEGENALVMADTSGSMTWTDNPKPIDVALSLALYFAERNKDGAFANHFMTFAGQPRLQEIIGETLMDKYRNMNLGICDNTNLSRAFDLILNIAVRNNVPQKDLPGKLYIISDMQFDGCVDGSDRTSFQRAKTSFAEHGYELPEVVFWNVAARNDNVPVTTNDVGVQLVSGCSPVIFKQILSGISAYELMLEIVNGDRYRRINL